ncbi:MAG: hypothetical protein AAGA54_24740 [Myxococcota bacterium]
MSAAEGLLDQDCEVLEDNEDFTSGRSYFHAIEMATIRKNTGGADIDTVTHLSTRCFSFREPSSGEIFAPDRTGLECVIQEVRADLEISRGIVDGTVQRRVVYSAQIVGGSPDTAKVVTDWAPANPTPQIRDLGQHWNDNSDPYRTPAFSDYDGPLGILAMFARGAGPYIGGAMLALDLQHDWGPEGWLLSDSRRSGSDGDLQTLRSTGKTVFSQIPIVDPSYSFRHMNLTSG